jgi:hypothetical protein
LRDSLEIPKSIIGVITESPDDLIATVNEAVMVQVAMDSAAVDNVINSNELPQNAEIVPNTTGKHFRGANNAHIEKYGVTSTILESKDNRVICDWAVSDVNQALHSVAKVAGPPKVPGKQDVLFDNDQCVVMPPGIVKELLKRIKPVMRYEREGNLYLAQLKMSSFTRPGTNA